MADFSADAGVIVVDGNGDPITLRAPPLVVVFVDFNDDDADAEIDGTVDPLSASKVTVDAMAAYTIV
jgi:hypothetical protein